MKCPYCESEQTYCVDSRQVQAERRRKYQCASCGEKFKTTERVVSDPTKIGKEGRG